MQHINKISIITAVYNRVDTIEKSLQSIELQTYKNIEHIIIDGGSNDGTLDLLNQFKKNNSILISEDDFGVYFALNKGLLLASGDIVGFMHSDDFYAHNKVLEEIANIFEDPSIDAVYGDLVYVRKNKTEKKVRFWRAGIFSKKSLCYGWMPPHPTLYVRKRIYDQVGAFDVRYKVSADYLSILKIFNIKNIKVHYIPKVLVNMRVGGVSNSSFNNILHKMREDISIIKKTNTGGFFTLTLKNFRKIYQFIC